MRNNKIVLGLLLALGPRRSHSQTTLKVGPIYSMDRSRKNYLGEPRNNT